MCLRLLFNTLLPFFGRFSQMDIKESTKGVVVDLVILK